ncbi:MAG: hypothetical protein KGL18_10820 [Burkholderiales bacterium]|nr:hypothetical protein [Burkholderiales bacterium]MDE1926571.1 hypothetical protein [Burkholderiales bacterium]MDE2159081.1 hypothetical protein [Burkholderiales bacterium]MDE2503447.1 hypothetical protein [Burkholderiales bacterium]
MMIMLKSPKPRNPWVAAALRRPAGRHGPRAGSHHQRLQRELRVELERLRPSP